MAFNNSFTAVVGATYTAAQYNTHVRDNFTAIWVYTTAGDIVYATSATALARLGKPSVDSLLKNTSAGVPSWLSISDLLILATGRLLAPSGVTMTTERTTTSSSFQDVTGMSTAITVGVNSYLLAFYAGSAAIAGDFNYFGKFRLHIDGTGQADDTSLPQTYMSQYAPISGFYYRNVSSGTKTVKSESKSTHPSNGTTVYFVGGQLIVLAFSY